MTDSTTITMIEALELSLKLWKALATDERLTTLYNREENKTTPYVEDRIKCIGNKMLNQDDRVTHCPLCYYVNKQVQIHGLTPSDQDSESSCKIYCPMFGYWSIASASSCMEKGSFYRNWINSVRSANKESAIYYADCIATNLKKILAIAHKLETKAATRKIAKAILKIRAAEAENK